MLEWPRAIAGQKKSLCLLKKCKAVCCKTVNFFPQSRRIAFLGGYVPRRCGIATFTHHLCEAVAAQQPDAKCIVVAVNDRPEGYDYPERVLFEIDEKDPDSYLAAADGLNQSQADVLCVQHEFGIYGGPAGSHLLGLLKQLRMPIVTTLHTILNEPDAGQRRVMDEIIRVSDRLVVMANKGAEILRETYNVSASKIDVIAHGIPDVPFSGTEKYKEHLGVSGKFVLLILVRVQVEVNNPRPSADSFDFRVV